MEFLFGYREMVVSELKFFIVFLLKDCINGGDVSGIEFLGVFFGVICIGFVLLVFLWKLGGRGFDDVIVFSFERVFFVFVLYKIGGKELILFDDENYVRMGRKKISGIVFEIKKMSLFGYCW